MSEVSPEARLWDLMRGTMTAKALAVAPDLGIADALSHGPRSSADLAVERSADADTLYRVLRALASDGVFAEDEPGVFRNTEASELLKRDRGDGWPEFAHLFGDVFAEAIAGLNPRSHDETFSDRYGKDFWSWLAAHPDERRDERALGDRISFVAGDFFERVPTGDATSSRGSCTTGMMSARLRSSGRFAQRLRRVRGCSFSIRWSAKATSRVGRSGWTS